MGTEVDLIEGIIITPLKQIADNRGAVFHVLRNDANHFTQFGEVYISKVNPGVIKAWKYHKEMTQNFCVSHGELKLVVFDDRNDSETYGLINEFLLDSDQNYNLITLPPKIWYGFKCLSKEHCLLLNVADMVHDQTESISKDFKENIIPYKWMI
jgi:dTDP-4-dehydrorhamnose 3,5-epimerase